MPGDRGSGALRLVSVLSAVIGGAPLLGLGLFLWLGSVEIVPLAVADPVGVALWDAAISVAFFLQHSGMVRRGFRVRVERYVDPAVYPALYSIASGIALLLVLVLWQRSSTVVWSVPLPWGLALRAAFVSAVVGFVWGLQALRGFDGFGLRQIRDLVRSRTRPPEGLAIRGPYRWVRHPLYSFVLIMMWACPEATLDRVLLNGLWSLWVIVGAVLEERDLLRDFGDDYARYQDAVPMIVPRTLRPAWSDGIGERNA